MPYRAPTVDNFQHAKWMRQSFCFNECLDPFLNPMVDNVRLASGRADRSDSNKYLKRTLSAILANLYYTHINDENRYVIIDRSNDGYRRGLLNPLELNRRSVQDCVRYLLASNRPYIE